MRKRQLPLRRIEITFLAKLSPCTLFRCPLLSIREGRKLQTRSAPRFCKNSSCLRNCFDDSMDRFWLLKYKTLQRRNRTPPLYAASFHNKWEESMGSMVLCVFPVCNLLKRVFVSFFLIHCPPPHTHYQRIRFSKFKCRHQFVMLPLLGVVPLP